jgi:hypothetical protein
VPNIPVILQGRKQLVDKVKLLNPQVVTADAFSFEKAINTAINKDHTLDENPSN